jgi:hypothetical protein
VGLRFAKEVYTFTTKGAPLHIGAKKAEPLLALLNIHQLYGGDEN